MHAVEYTKKLRLTATVSWVGSLAVFFLLAWLGLVPFNEYLPFLALLAGTVPIAAFMIRNRPSCSKCGGPMRTSRGYPRIEYTCKSCGAEVKTGIHPDY